jgi:hypothetical protein
MKNFLAFGLKRFNEGNWEGKEGSLLFSLLKYIGRLQKISYYIPNKVNIIFQLNFLTGSIFKALNKNESNRILLNMDNLFNCEK